MSAQNGPPTPSRGLEEITVSILEPGGILDRAEAALKRSLDSNPENSQALRKLAETYRKKGDFQAAAKSLERLRSLDPTNLMASYLCQVMKGEEPQKLACETELRPAPFVRAENFLSAELRGDLLEFATSHRSRFRPSRVRKGGQSSERKLDQRTSFVLPRNELEAFGPRFLARIRSVLPSLLPRLQQDRFSMHRMELQLTAHLGGGFFKTHQDNCEPFETRKTTFVYYFHRVPRRFSGGELLLYDTDLERKEYSAAFSKIEPIENSVVFFPSGYFHQVTPVRSQSYDFCDARFTLNGWAHYDRTKPH